MNPGGGPKIIIVKKKVKSHGGHHGGSWKVAYADFVTAMMAFFLVMWIMSMDQGVKDLVEGYFQNPVGFKRSFSGGKNILSQGNSIVNAEVRRTLVLKRREEEQMLQDAANQIAARIEDGEMAQAGAEVELVLTGEGLRIELMETGSESVYFTQASADLTPALRRLLAFMGSELQELPESVVLEGHTDATPFGRNGYTNWELSVDRANAARRALVAGGLSESRIVEVRGYADRRPKVEDAPTDPRNRRISILLQFVAPDPNLVKLGALHDAVASPVDTSRAPSEGDL